MRWLFLILLVLGTGAAAALGGSWLRRRKRGAVHPPGGALVPEARKLSVAGCLFVALLVVLLPFAAVLAVYVLSRHEAPPQMEMRGALAAPEAAPVVMPPVDNPAPAGQFEDEIIRLARERVNGIRVLHEAGRAAPLELVEAEGELAIAEARGNLLKQAEARLATATKVLERLEPLRADGRATEAEVNRAKLDHLIRVRAS